MQRYVLLLPEDFRKGREYHLLIALHGHGSDRWQYVREERGECRGVRDVAARYGMILVSPDYRAKTSWMGPKAEADVRQIIGAMRRQYRIGKLFLAGGSMGGSSALTFAALYPRLVDGVSAQNPIANHLEYEGFQEAIAESFGGGKAHIPLEYKKRSAEYWPERLTMPVAITTGGRDEAVPPGSALRLAAVLKAIGRKAFLIHRPEEGHQTGYEDTVAALEFVVRAALNDKEAALK
ncbi:MAG: alpha/beta fold hydrolase [Armatimonadetes bacterium]|nr:alpha/beta fold hydrolase [Armatimonadota bacterium]